MKKILLTNNDLPSVNIGDYTQSLAAKQFVNDSNIGYVNRDEMNLYEGDEAKAVMNAWFTYKPENFPPSNKIHPLFVSFHLNSVYGKTILENPKAISYFKNNEPIGCRDNNTVKLLSSKGVESYFSGCLTTTLGYKYKSTNPRKEKIYIVDPLSYMPNGNTVIEIAKTLVDYAMNFRAVNKIIKNYKQNNIFKTTFSKIGIGRILLATKSFKLLSNIFDAEVLDDAIYITQFHMNSEYNTDESRFARAEELLYKFSEAKLVITSRIHCALPCLGIDTPVLFLVNNKDVEKSACRLDGLADFFNKIKFVNDRMVSSDLQVNGKFNLKNIPTQNKKIHVKYAEQLASKVKNFFYDEK